MVALWVKPVIGTAGQKRKRHNKLAERSKLGNKNIPSWDPAVNGTDVRVQNFSLKRKVKSRAVVQQHLRQPKNTTWWHSNLPPWQQGPAESEAHANVAAPAHTAVPLEVQQTCHLLRVEQGTHTPSKEGSIPCTGQQWQSVRVHLRGIICCEVSYCVSFPWNTIKSFSVTYNPADRAESWPQLFCLLET